MASQRGLCIKNDGAEKQLYRAYKSGAKQRGLSFNISFEEFLKITKENCYLCGTSPYQIRKKQAKINSEAKDYVYNGIDRVDSTIGYELNNIKPCCHRCNLMKRSMTLGDFLSHIKTIINKLKN